MLLTFTRALLTIESFEALQEKARCALGHTLYMTVELSEQKSFCSCHTFHLHQSTFVLMSPLSRLLA